MVLQQDFASERQRGSLKSGVLLIALLAGCGSPVADSERLEADVAYQPFETTFLQPEHVVLNGIGPDRLGGLAVDSKGSIYALNEGSGRVQKHSSHGRLIQTLGPEGESPGRFRFVLDLAVDRQDNLYVLDTGLSRVSVFSSLGEPLRSFFFSAQGFVGVKLTVAPASGDVYIGARVPPADRDGLIFRFDREGRFISNLYPIDSKVEEFNLRVIGGASFVLDRDEKLYAVQRIRAGFDQILPDGGMTRLGGTPEFYRPPFRFPDQLPDDRGEVAALLAQFSQTTDLLLVSDEVILIVYRAYSPSEYVIEVFDTQGHRLAGPIPSRGRPISAVGDRGEVVFLEPDAQSSQVELKKYQVSWEK